MVQVKRKFESTYPFPVTQITSATPAGSYPVGTVAYDTTEDLIKVSDGTTWRLPSAGTIRRATVTDPALAPPPVDNEMFLLDDATGNLWARSPTNTWEPAFNTYRDIRASVYAGTTVTTASGLGPSTYAQFPLDSIRDNSPLFTTLGGGVSGGMITVPTDGLWMISAGLSLITSGGGTLKFFVAGSMTSVKANWILFGGCYDPSTSASALKSDGRVTTFRRLLAGSQLGMYYYCNVGGLQFTSATSNPASGVGAIELVHMGD